MERKAIMAIWLIPDKTLIHGTDGFRLYLTLRVYDLSMSKALDCYRKK